MLLTGSNREDRLRKPVADSGAADDGHIRLKEQEAVSTRQQP